MKMDSNKKFGIAMSVFLILTISTVLGTINTSTEHSEPSELTDEDDTSSTSTLYNLEEVEGACGFYSNTHFDRYRDNWGRMNGLSLETAYLIEGMVLPLNFIISCSDRYVQFIDCHFSEKVTLFDVDNIQWINCSFEPLELKYSDANTFIGCKFNDSLFMDGHSNDNQVYLNTFTEFATVENVGTSNTFYHSELYLGNFYAMDHYISSVDDLSIDSEDITPLSSEIFHSIYNESGIVATNIYNFNHEVSLTGDSYSYISIPKIDEINVNVDVLNEIDYLQGNYVFNMQPDLEITYDCQSVFISYINTTINVGLLSTFSLLEDGNYSIIIDYGTLTGESNTILIPIIKETAGPNIAEIGESILISQEEDIYLSIDLTDASIIDTIRTNISSNDFAATILQENLSIECFSGISTYFIGLPINLSTIEDGTYTCDVEVWDIYDNYNHRSFEIIIDTTSPVLAVEIEQGPHSEIPSLNVSIVDSTETEIWCNDIEISQGCNPLPTPIWESLPEGQSTLVFTAVDEARLSTIVEIVIEKDTSYESLSCEFNNYEDMEIFTTNSIPTVRIETTDSNFANITIDTMFEQLTRYEASTEIMVFSHEQWLQLSESIVHDITITAHDSLGNSMVSTLSFMKDTIPISFELDDSINGTYYNSVNDSVILELTIYGSLDEIKSVAIIAEVDGEDGEEYVHYIPLEYLDTMTITYKLDSEFWAEIYGASNGLINLRIVIEDQAGNCEEQRIVIHTDVYSYISQYDLYIYGIGGLVGLIGVIIVGKSIKKLITSKSKNKKNKLTARVTGGDLFSI